MTEEAAEYGGTRMHFSRVSVEIVILWGLGVLYKITEPG